MHYDLTMYWDSKLAIGADAGFLQKSIDGDWIATDMGDPSIPAGSVSQGVFDLGAGVYFNSEKVYLGVSALHLNEAEIKFDDAKTDLVRHLYGMAGLNLHLSPLYLLHHQHT